MTMLPALATWYFPAGVAIGVAAAAPVGPVNLLVVQRALAQGSAPALLLGAGAALGDALFAVVAAFGLGAVARLLDEHMEAIRLVGGLVMLIFAVVVWRAAPKLGTASEPRSAWRMALVTFGMTVTNPATLLFFVGSFGSVGFVAIGHDTAAHRINAGELVVGVLAGSMLWWLAVSTVARRFRARVADRHLALLNHATAGVLALFGVGAIGTGLLAA